MVIIKSNEQSNQILPNFPNRRNCLKDLLKSDFTLHNDFNIADKGIICDLLVKNCEDCKKMAALPQGAFAACKLRELRDRDLLVARMKSGSDKGEPKNMNTNKKLTEYTPAKYNDKLMNSIWGFYNRYSPHNIKGNEYESSKKDYMMQQHIAVASHAIAEDLAMALRSGKEWDLREK
ncbi:PREDICTED: uncharacterized protein LOC108364355 [Rhagoletis zephyria]|uniref:uncharacterized protein LOC108364355 n=1 Tax=Rhagoletis zephyria TaxID=28612 RepID=UPI0008117FCE|nr:PREDICTED: uncharacterized protein LOC108364355 [Rhagoletis zephyria]XP_017473495.1 PREDICTED: uncharacterized protein LOC108364355 [Rhagoletis zephyria]